LFPPPPQRPECSLQQELQHWELREQGRPFGRHVAATCAGDRTAMLSTARPAATPTRRIATRRPSARRVSRLEPESHADPSMSPARSRRRSTSRTDASSSGSPNASLVRRATSASPLRPSHWRHTAAAVGPRQ